MTDLDGTLWEREAHVHERTRAALGAMTAAGLPLVVATGRRSGSARPALSAIGLAPPAVLLNGALGLDLTSGTRFHRGEVRPRGRRRGAGRFPRPRGRAVHLHRPRRHPVCVGSAPSTHSDHLVSFGDDVVTRDLVEVVRDGVAAFCSEHQLDVGAVMAIGDGPNHIELPANAAVAVVPSDAHPAARLHADLIVGCAEDGGWADILEILGIP